jgi:hypothetical protein
MQGKDEFLIILCLCLSLFLRSTAVGEHHLPPKVYALYFPQFHEDPVNNRIWGKGYTDWDNLNKAPAYNRFNRSIIRPDESIGFYNLTNFEIRRKHAELAKQYGVDGFIYHHYWFHHRGQGAILAAPLEKMLIDGEPNISFAFNWAMDSWQGTWHGRGNLGQVLYEQVCPPVGDQRIIDHYNYLKQFFHHPNYVKVNNVPLFFVLRSTPNKCHGILKKMKEYARADGFPEPGLYIVGGSNPMSFHEVYRDKPNAPYDNHYDGDYFYPFASFPDRQAKIPARCMSAKPLYKKEDRVQYLSTITHFDHTPRRNLSHATIWDRSFNALGPAKSFELDLTTMMTYDRCCQSEHTRSAGGKFVIVNAWNEWAEGMCLEPSREFGYQFLEAVKNAKQAVKIIKCQWPVYNNYFNKLNKVNETK